MKNHQKLKRKKHIKRHKRIRAKINGTSKRPRFSVFRSSKAMYVQLINDEKGKTLASAHSREIHKEPLKTAKTSLKITKKVAIAYELGKLLAEKALKLKIKKVVFDRGGYKYHGRVKAIAEGAREGGLKF